MRIIFLGTNGWYATSTGNTTCILIETEKEYIILDAGDGIYKIDRFITKNKPVYLFLSHLHLDHIYGLHMLAKFCFTQGIKIYITAGMKNKLNKIICRPFSAPFKNLRTKVRLFNLDKKTKLPFKLLFKKLRHPSLCFGFRFLLEGKIVSYCTDTGVCPNFLILAKNADLLIAECSFAPGVRSKSWPHLNPQDAALLAKKSGVRKLALMHFDANVYRDFSQRRKAEEKARKIFKNTFVTFDDLEIRLV